MIINWWMAAKYVPIGQCELHTISLLISGFFLQFLGVISINFISYLFSQLFMTFTRGIATSLV